MVIMFTKVLKVIAIVLFLPLTFILSVFVHEYGHAISAHALGYEGFRFYIWPGYEIAPQLGNKYPQEWPRNAIAFGHYSPKKFDLDVAYDEALGRFTLTTKLSANQPQKLTHLQEGIIGLSGSALNLMIAILSVLLIRHFRPQGVSLYVLRIGSMLFYDILTYTIFPVFFNTKHLVYWGGSEAEPVIALAKLGIPEEVSIAAIVSICLLLSFALVRHTISNRKKTLLVDKKTEPRPPTLQS